MGRVKLKIQKLGSKPSRVTTYSKRKNGLIKKTNELAILCDIDIALLMFSPSGKPVLWTGKNRDGVERIDYEVLINSQANSRLRSAIVKKT